MEHEFWQVGLDALYLAGCALHGKTAKWEPEKDLTALYDFCKFHSITAIVAMALEAYWKENPPADPEVMKPWKQAKEKSIRKNILLNAEREEILRQLEKMGCWYMPLKGSLLQHDYPKFGMRQMSDNDILFDESFRAAVHDMMYERGYAVKAYHTGIEDVYQKEPVYHFEMHVALCEKIWKPEHAAYYDNIHTKMIKDPGNHYGRCLSEEDFYIYMTTHAYRHFAGSGTGVRHLLDVWVYIRKHPQMNWAYIAAELETLDAADFEYLCRQIAGKLLDDPGKAAQLTRQEQETLHLLMASGAYGTKVVKLENKVRKFQGGGVREKFAHIRSRLFPSAEYLAVLNPEVLEHRWLVPLIWIRRILRAVLTAPGEIICELKSLRKMK